MSIINSKAAYYLRDQLTRHGFIDTINPNKQKFENITPIPMWLNETKITHV